MINLEIKADILMAQRKRLDLHARNRLSNYNDHTYQKIKEYKKDYVDTYKEDTEWFHYNQKHISPKYIKEFAEVQRRIKTENIIECLDHLLENICQRINNHEDAVSITKDIENYGIEVYGACFILTKDQFIYYRLAIDYVCQALSSIVGFQINDYKEAYKKDMERQKKLLKSRANDTHK